MGTRPIKRGSPPRRNLVIIVAKKRKKSGQKRRQSFLRGMKKFAVAMYWFASFVLILLNIWMILKNLY